MAAHFHLRRRRLPHRRPLRLLDEKFLACPGQYLRKCLAATLAMFVILSLLDVVTQTVLIASLGASAFIAFTMPHVASSRPFGISVTAASSSRGIETSETAMPQAVPTR